MFIIVLGSFCLGNQPSRIGGVVSEGLYGSRVLLNREWRLLKLVSQGWKNEDIAKMLSTTLHVVKNQLRTVYDKAGVSNRVELALWYEARVHYGEIPLGHDSEIPSRRPAQPVSAERGLRLEEVK